MTTLATSNRHGDVGCDSTDLSVGRVRGNISHFSHVQCLEGFP